MEASTTRGVIFRSRTGWLSVPGVLALLVIAVLPSGFSRSATAMEPGEQVAVSSPEELTDALVVLSARLQAATPAEQPALARRVRAVAAARRQLLEALVQDEPNAVLRAALAAALRSQLPAGVRRYVERQVTLEGDLHVMVEDRLRSSRTHYTLHTRTGRRYSLHFAGPTPRLRSGAHVRVRGMRVGNAIAMAAPEATTKSFEALTVVAPDTFGEQRTLVMLVNFSDDASQPYTVEYARDVVFNTTSAFDLENSYQQTWLSGDVVGWFGIPVSRTTCDTNAIANAANAAAAAAGVNLAAYGRYVYGFPSNACGFWGLATVGGNPSMAWINGDFSLRVVGHEMGHNFGLYHSHSYDCGTVPVEWTGCSVDEYGDSADMMGGQTAHFNAFQKERLGWLNYAASPTITEVQAGGVFDLEPYEVAGSGGTKALKILRGVDPVTGERTWYYVEYRQAIGFDAAFAGNTNMLAGVVIRSASESDANKSYLLDMTPDSASWLDPALTVGRTFVDPDGTVSVNVLSADGGGASVAVSRAPACVRANPTVDVTATAAGTLAPGASATYVVTITNNDSAACGASGFALRPTVPGGWTASLATAAVTVNPGASASTTLKVTASAGSADGSYTIAVRAANSAVPTFAASDTITASVRAPLVVTVRTDRAAYSRMQSAYIIVTLRLRNAAVGGAAVTLNVVKANGATAVLRATSPSTGSVMFRYGIGWGDPRGTYVARVTATKGSASGSASTSFTVR